MRAAKCENGHYFYPEKSEECPECGTNEYVLIGEKPKNYWTAEKKRRSSFKMKKDENVLNKKEKDNKAKKNIKKSRKTVQETSANTPTISEANISVGREGKENTPTIPEANIVDYNREEDTPVKTNDDQKTIYPGRSSSMGIEPVTGWLVCISGENKGKSYGLKEGKNMIGVAADMNVVIENDEKISRDILAVIAYDPVSKEFFVLPGKSGNSLEINGQLLNLNMSSVLKDRDILLIGEIKFVFVAFCSKEFNWD